MLRRSPPAQSSTGDTGRRAEQLAVRYMRRRFYRIVDRNFLCRAGEIDIIAQRGGLLIFVEVRSRTEPDLIHPWETVDLDKMVRMVSAARFYMHLNGGHRQRVRFDVIGIRFRADSGRPRLLHIPGAFNMDDLKPPPWRRS